MTVITWSLAALAVIGWGVALIALVIVRRRRVAAVEWVTQLRRTVAPYLLRLTEEVSISTEPLDPRGAADLGQVTDHLCQLARVLTVQERQCIGHADTVNMGGSDTIPLEISKLQQEE